MSTLDVNLPASSETSRVADHGPPSTLWRLLRSRHLRDIQVILVMAVAVLVIAACVFLGIRLVADWPFLAIDSSDNKPLEAVAGAASAAAVATINWAYQTGSRRLGAVDLFGCEISAICRVSLVVDFARSSIEHHTALGARSAQEELFASGTGSDWTDRFTSAEQYTPVYDKNLSDLQPLDVNAVSCVTQFYTYRKSVMDFMRQLAATPDRTRKQALLGQMIYMQYLMYENARFAVSELVEFHPHRDESLVNVLCSELTLYGFLGEHHRGDFRNQRLELRIDDYARLVPELYARLQQHRGGRHWSKAWSIAPELFNRYEALRRQCRSLPALQR